MSALSAAELNILDWIAQHCRTVWLDGIMPRISALGDLGLVWILLGFGLVLFWKRDRSVGVQLLLALVINLILCNLLLKNGVGRTRPFVWNPEVSLLIPEPWDTSFPSGHSAASFAAAAVLIKTRWPGRWAVLILACLIAFSRLYLYVHFPTDVLGGCLVGILSGLLAVALWNKWLRPRWENKKCPPEGKKEPDEKTVDT